MPHVLYSKGHLQANVDRLVAIEQIASLTRRPIEEVEGRLVNGSRKKIKSSDSLSTLIALQQKFESIGLEVYITVND